MAGLVAVRRRASVGDDGPMTWTQAATVLACVYLACAFAGYVGGLRETLRLPPGASLYDLTGGRWTGIMWLPGRILWLYLLVSLTFWVLLFHIVLFLFGSPLFALSFFNRITGRRRPHGRMSKWYERQAMAVTKRPVSCSLPSPRRRRIMDFIARLDARFSGK